MASSRKGTASGSRGSSKKSLKERIKLVYQLSRVSDRVLKNTLQNWTDDEILEVLRSESKKELEYTGLTREEIINLLFKMIKEKKRRDREVGEKNSPPITRSFKKQRQSLSRFHNEKISGNGSIYCKNLACQAKLRGHETYCQRCSCCICHKYDDNKDHSLWLSCNTDLPFTIESCGLSWHLDCAFKSEKSGLKEDQSRNDVDGGFLCVSCGKSNSLLDSLKKQLMIVKEERRVDVVCFRLLLAQKLLKGTEKYKKISEQVEKAVESLEAELGGPLTDLPSATRRRIVNRLNSAKTLKDYCSSALELLDGTFTIRFENVLANSLKLKLVVEIQESSSRGNPCEYKVWHKKVSEEDYPQELTCSLSSQNTSFVVSGLAPATLYCFKAVSFSGGKELSVEEGKTETLLTEELAATTICSFQRDLLPPLHPFKPAFNSQNKRVKTRNDTHVRQIKKHTSTEEPVPIPENLHIISPLDDFVKVLRHLERFRFIDKNFRLKFLTWYIMKATPREKGAVKLFIKIFREDSSAFAEQLLHAFSRRISLSAIGDGGSGASAGLGMKPDR